MRIWQLPKRLRRLGHISYNRLFSLAIAAGAIPSHQDYTRYVIVGQSRCGSNFLRGLLNSHPGIIAYGELFRRYGELNWGLPQYPATRRQLALIRRDPVAFLEQEVFQRYPRHIRAVGFKLFYYHAANPEWQSVWRYLQERRDIRVIHLRRRNMLQTLVSRRIANLTQQWSLGNPHGRPLEAGPIRLDYDDCLRRFNINQRWERETAERFRNRPMIEIVYEDLARNYQGTLQHLQRFLGVEENSVTPQTRKQMRKPLAEQIANYAELKARFHGTPWAAFFDE